jgi:hypothetical protein
MTAPSRTEKFFPSKEIRKSFSAERRAPRGRDGELEMLENRP